MLSVSHPEGKLMGHQPFFFSDVCGAAHHPRLLAVLPVMKSSHVLLRRCPIVQLFTPSHEKEKEVSMQQPLSSTRVGPMMGLVGSTIVCIVFFLPLGSFGSEWDNIAWQGIVDPMVVLVLLAALALLGFSAAALFRTSSPVLSGLSLLAASVGLLAQLYVLLAGSMNMGLTLTNLPRLFTFLGSGLFLWGGWLPLLGFLLSGCGIALSAMKDEWQAGVSLQRDHLPAFLGTEQSASETQPGERAGGRQPGSQVLDEKENVWSIGRRHIMAMIVGVLIYSVLSNLYIFWEGPGEGNFEIVFPAIVLVLFFGVVYGPWVGLVTGGLGSFLNNSIGTLTHTSYWMLSNYGTLNSVPFDASHPRIYWPLVVGSALVGFMAGLPLFGTVGWDKTIRSLLAVMMRSALGIVVGISLTVVLYQVRLPVEMTLLLINIQGSFTYETIPTLLVVVLLLPPLLVLFPSRTTRRREV